jgi:hypothetical protein
MKDSPPNGPVVGQVDSREALYNDNPVGLAGVIQVPAERITALLGIVADLDPKLLIPGNPLFPPDPDPRKFHAAIRPVLDRHPLARHGEVRSSGTGLHLILRLDPSVELRTSADQRRWATIVRAVLGSLPSDPNAPGITALTRPIGSINSKNEAVVELLQPGQSISPKDIGAFVEELVEAPFRTVALPLLGSDRVAPCPACQAPGSSLGVLDRLGRCYHCGDVRLERLLDLVYAPAGQGEPSGAGRGKPPREEGPEDGAKTGRSTTRRPSPATPKPLRTR